MERGTVTAPFVFDGVQARLAEAAGFEAAARDLSGIPQVLTSWLVTPTEARQMGFAIYIHLGVMLRRLADFQASLEELRDTGRVHVPCESLSGEPITRLLARECSE